LVNNNHGEIRGTNNVYFSHPPAAKHKTGCAISGGSRGCHTRTRPRRECGEKGALDWRVFATQLGAAQAQATNGYLPLKNTMHAILVKFALRHARCKREGRHTFSSGSLRLFSRAHNLAASPSDGRARTHSKSEHTQIDCVECAAARAGQIANVRSRKCSTRACTGLGSGFS
jgi:hypothetical protein